MKKNYYYAVGNIYGGIYETFGLHNNKKELKKELKYKTPLQHRFFKIVKVKIEIIEEI